MLGIVGFSGQIPTFLFALFAGVWVDRLDRRRVLVAFGPPIPVEAEPEARVRREKADALTEQLLKAIQVLLA